MALNTLAITATSNEANIALRGDMSVLLDTAVSSNFRVNLFTTTDETFVLNTTKFKFRNLQGELSNSFTFGGKPGLFVELMFDPVSGVWYIIANNIQGSTGTLQAEVDRLTELLEAVRAVAPATQADTDEAITNHRGFPLYNIGSSFNYRGMPVRRIDNGISSRYTAGSFRINADIPPPNLTDPTNFGWQNLGYITIPGGTLVGKNVAVLNFVLNCAAQFGSASSWIFVSISSSGDGESGNFFTRPVASATSGNFSCTLTSKESSTISLNGNGWSSYTGGSTKRCNLLKDITITIKWSSASGVGRAVSLGSASLDVLDGVTVSRPGVVYRDPTIQPFKSSSFWNTPLGAGATYQLATDPETASVIVTSPGGVNAGAYPWIGGIQGGANNFVQCRESDPISNFTFASRAMYGPWPFATSSLTNGSFKMHAPAGEFITGQSTDRVVTLISPDKRYMMESGGYSYNAETKTHALGYCTVWDLYGSGASNAIDQYSFLSEGYRASGHPISGGIVRKEELDALQINHVISMQLSNYQQKCAMFQIVGTPAGGTTFSVKPVDTLQTAQSYTALFKSGQVVYFAGTGYTLTADSTYNSQNNTTNMTVTTTISGTAVNLYLGGTTTAAQQLTQLVWPATCVDGYSVVPGTTNFYRGLVPMGAMFAIPANVDLTTLGIKSPEGLALARAFQKFGGINNDTTSKTLNLCFLDTGVSASQKSGLQGDIVAIRNALRMVTNISAANPGGPGTRLVPPPPDLQPLY